MPGLSESPGCGFETSSLAGTGVTDSSVLDKLHLQFHRSPGRCSFQNLSLMGRMIPQYLRCSLQGCRLVDGIHLRLGSTSLSRLNCCQSAAWCARMTAVSYSVLSHAPHWWEAMGITSFNHWLNDFRTPFESSIRAAISFCVRCTLNAEKTSLLCRNCCWKSLSWSEDEKASSVAWLNTSRTTS